MNIKKLLLCISALSGLVMANAISAAQPPGTDSAITKAKIICPGTLSGDVALTTVVGAGQQKGIESSWLITNTSATDSLSITQIDSYGMNGKLLTRVTPATHPNLKTETGGFFDWTVKPQQLVRFPHDYTMVYPNAAAGIVGTNPLLVRWYNVVISLQSTSGAPISAPLVTAAMVERTEDLTVTPATHFVLSRTRNECKFMM